MSRTLPIPTRRAGEPELTAWLGRLIEAATPEEVGALIETLVQSQRGCAKAKVLWLNSPDEQHRPAQQQPDPTQLTLVQAALASANGMQSTPDGKQCALTLLGEEQVVLLLTLAADGSAKTLLADASPYLQLGVRQLHHAMKLADLYDSHAQLEHSENLQRALFVISDLAGSNLDMPRCCTRSIASSAV